MTKFFSPFSSVSYTHLDVYKRQAGAGLDALGGSYRSADGQPVWLADVELEPYQALLVKNV